MDWVIMIIVGFGIVGSVEARMRALLRIHEIKLERITEAVERSERKLDTLRNTER